MGLNMHLYQSKPGSCEEVLVTEVVLAVAVDIAGLGRVSQPGSLVGVQRWVGVQALRHLVADHIYKSLKHSLEI